MWDLDESILSLENARIVKERERGGRCKILHRFIPVKKRIGHAMRALGLAWPAGRDLRIVSTVGGITSPQLAPSPAGHDGRARPVLANCDLRPHRWRWPAPSPCRARMGPDQPRQHGPSLMETDTDAIGRLCCRNKQIKKGKKVAGRWKEKGWARCRSHTTQEVWIGLLVILLSLHGTSLSPLWVDPPSRMLLKQ